MVVDVRSQLILWTGQKHSGKTTQAGTLVQTARGQGFEVAGLLAPDIRPFGCAQDGLGGALLGYDVVDLRQGTRAPLARRKRGAGFHRGDRGEKIEIGILGVLGGKACGAVGRFTFLAAGLELGRTALSRESTRSADLIVVDEFGPLELDGGGWRMNVDELLTAGNGLVLLVVRDQLVGLVSKAYSHVPLIAIPASGTNSAGRVIELLRRRRQITQGVK